MIPVTAGHKVTSEGKKRWGLLMCSGCRVCLAENDKHTRYKKCSTLASSTSSMWRRWWDWLFDVNGPENTHWGQSWGVHWQGHRLQWEEGSVKKTSTSTTTTTLACQLAARMRMQRNANTCYRVHQYRPGISRLTATGPVHRAPCCPPGLLRGSVE